MGTLSAQQIAHEGEVGTPLKGGTLWAEGSHDAEGRKSWDLLAERSHEPWDPMYQKVPQPLGRRTFGCDHFLAYAPACGVLS